MLYPLETIKLPSATKTINQLKNAGFTDWNSVAEFIQINGPTALVGVGVKNRGIFRNKIRPKLVELELLPQLPTIEELENKLTIKLVNMVEAAAILNVSFETLKNLVAKESLNSEFYYSAGEDFEPSHVNQKYVFNQELIQDFSRQFTTLVKIADELGVESLHLGILLRKVLTKEENEKYKLSPRNYHRQYIVDNYQQFLDRRAELRSEVQQFKHYYELLHPSVQRFIDDYFHYRFNSEEITFDSVHYANVKLVRGPTVDHYRENLVRILYRIICGRMGIEKFTEIEKNRAYRNLTEDEEEMISNYELDIGSISPKDTAFMVSGLQSETYKYRLSKAFKPFLFYFLMKKEEDYNEKLEQALTNNDMQFNGQREWEKLRLIKNRFDKTLKNGIAIKQPKVPKDKKRRKVFATRSQLVNCINAILTNNVIGSRGIRSPLKFSVQFMIGFFAGIRPIELFRMEIDKHLDIETEPDHPDFGLMKKYRIETKGEEGAFVRTSIDDENGWGRIIITEDISKGNYSPSPEYGTLAVPALVDHINLYLKQLYRRYPKQKKAVGFLFRAEDRNQFRGYRKPTGLTNWIWRYRDSFLGILTEEEIRSFSYYETRHTVNNLIVNRTRYQDPAVNQWRLRVAETHCRHEISDDDLDVLSAKGKTNREHYQQSVPLKIYYLGLKAALVYPFDSNELDNWERQNNPMYQPTFDEVEMEQANIAPASSQLSEHEHRELEVINDELLKLNEKRAILRVPARAARVYNLTGKDRLSELAHINIQLQALETKKQKLEYGGK